MSTPRVTSYEVLALKATSDVVKLQEVPYPNKHEDLGMILTTILFEYLLVVLLRGISRVEQG